METWQPRQRHNQSRCGGGGGGGGGGGLELKVVREMNRD